MSIETKEMHIIIFYSFNIVVLYNLRLMKKGKMHTLQSSAYLRARTTAAFLSRSDSKTNTKDCPFLDCQNNDLAARFPPPLNPHS
ncbi:hypothetical protein HanXRQr2_Chr13g0592651 [Helianthus annuus]|uniref:Uncharacterized protein n=1 Tax=Helianthus annuus TaxID=4232 RepID=A0A9K3EIH0_HELAN|nr:hypothetical protein HanXRQr2_Chr13g0592651 [Helianthus annuus]